MAPLNPSGGFPPYFTRCDRFHHSHHASDQTILPTVPAKARFQTSRTHDQRSPSVTTPQHRAVVGLQWGDEGKGKVVDILAEQHDFVVRYNGGANAGHTVVVGDQRYALHLIPSGILYPDTVCVIGNGVVIDPEQVLREREGLIARGVRVDSGNLKISNRAHVVMPWHKTLDEALENLLAGGDGRDHSIGTTRRGIGPAYADKITRATSIRVGDLVDPQRLRARLEVTTYIKNAQLLAFDPQHEPIDADALLAYCEELGRQIAPHVTDTTYLLHDANREGKRVLFEGANACLLDIDHGTFPYVTSSNCSALGIPAGTGLPSSCVNSVVGIMKAYSTRVGAGPFPTELVDHTAEYIRERGHEYGTTTGRPRRCGWLDLVATRYSAMICGATSLVVTLLDVLAGLDELHLCTAYEINGEKTDRFRPDASDLEPAKPVFETLPGFKEEITEVTSWGDLPENAKRYLDRIREYIDVPIEKVSVGPGRGQTITI